jgi:DNA-binding CsgD family transcriptional regulator
MSVTGEPEENLADRVNNVLPSLVDEEPVVVGTVDSELLIERVSSEAESVLGYRPEDLIGKPVLRLVDAGDSTALLRAFAQSATSGRRVRTRLQIPSPGRGPQFRHLLVHPLNPAPSFAFALVPRHDSATEDGPSTARMLARLGLHLSAIEASAVAPHFRADVRGMARLSTRELEIVTRLLAGDRVPAIAASLFITAGSVRNRLSSVFAKLGVHSQQELITLLRRHDPQA